MMRTHSFSSGAFRFALVIAGLFAAGAILLLVVVDKSIDAYASEAITAGLQAETAILTREANRSIAPALIDAIRRRQRLEPGQAFRYLLVSSAGHRLAGDLPGVAARVGRGTVSFVDDRPKAGNMPKPEVLQSLGTRFRDGSTLIVATDIYDIEALQGWLAWFSVWWGVGITGMVLVGGYIAGALALRRLDRVNSAIVRIMKGDLAERLPAIGRSPELGRLSSNLNSMLERIGAQVEGLRQIANDIGHDLRTPLTRLKLHLEALRGRGDLAAYESGIDHMTALVDETLSIFQTLLEIGLIEGGESPSRLETIDLSEIMVAVLQAYQPAAEDEGKNLEADVQRAISIHGDADLLTQLFANLIENAMTHTPTNTLITGSLHVDANHVVATIADNGPGVAAGERGKLVRRFYRLDRSRHSPGAGLGLTLVAAIAALHNAELLIEDNAPGLRVVVRFQPWTETPGSAIAP
ncbi:MAG: HAMP domain-containing histidine kinase [Sphingomonadales bacterium]|nr:HAMP domain-containing histidine kinase [Sphingomonadales bacterium]